MGARRTTPGGARQKIGSLSGGVTIRGGALTYRTEQGVEYPSIEPTNNRGAGTATGGDCAQAFSRRQE